MNYITIRTADGKLKAKLAGHHMANVMNDVQGHWGKIHWEGEKRKTCFYVDVGAEYVTSNYTGFVALNISKGDIIEQKRA